MSRMMAWLFFTILVLVAEGSARAAIVSKSGDICVVFTPDFVDLVGDYWATNSDKAARGFLVTVTDLTLGGLPRSRQAYLDDGTGCLAAYSVQAQSANGTITVDVVSKALMRSGTVALESWSGTTDASKTFKTASFTVSTGLTTTFATTLHLPAGDQVWRNLAVGSFAFYRFSFNITAPVSRDCCAASAPSYNADGTCPHPETDPAYTLITSPVQFMSDTSIGTCCNSQLPGSGAPGVHVYPNAPWRFVIAHELGHVVEGMRTGGYDGPQTAYDAPEDGCDGDNVPFDQRGDFSKEYMSLSLREGWANFASAVVWNERSEDGCIYQTGFPQDFDLDGDLDSDGAGGLSSGNDGIYNCEGIPEILDIYGHSIESYVTNINWLEDLEDADDNDVDGVQCVALSNDDQERNRSTVYDAFRLFWDLTTDEDLTPAQLSDLYVDMCPQAWAKADGTYDDSLPLERLKISADWNGMHTPLSEMLSDIERYPYPY